PHPTPATPPLPLGNERLATTAATTPAGGTQSAGLGRGSALPFVERAGDPPPLRVAGIDMGRQDVHRAADGPLAVGEIAAAQAAEVHPPGPAQAEQNGEQVDGPADDLIAGALHQRHLAGAGESHEAGLHVRQEQLELLLGELAAEAEIAENLPRRCDGEALA